MKKIIVIAFVIALVFTMSACAGKEATEEIGDIKVNIPVSDLNSADLKDFINQSDEKPSDTPAAVLGFENVTDMLDEQERLFDFHFDVLNTAPFPPMDIGLFGATYSFYNMMVTLNKDNEDGVFGDVYSMSGAIQKQGSVYTFARDVVYEMSAGEIMEGDAIHEVGDGDIAEGWLWSEFNQERDGAPIKLERNIQQFYPGLMVHMNQSLVDTDYIESDTRTHIVRFMISTEESYQFIVAYRRYTPSEGIDSLGISPNMTTAEIKDIFVANDYTLTHYGKSEGGELIDLL